MEKSFLKCLVVISLTKAIIKWLKEESPCCPICRKKIKSKEISNKVSEQEREPETQTNTPQESTSPELPHSSTLLSNDFNDDFYTQQTYENPNLIENLTNQLLNDLIGINNANVFNDTINSTIQNVIDASNIDASNVETETANEVIKYINIKLFIATSLLDFSTPLPPSPPSPPEEPSS